MPPAQSSARCATGILDSFLATLAPDEPLRLGGICKDWIWVLVQQELQDISSTAREVPRLSGSTDTSAWEGQDRSAQAHGITVLLSGGQASRGKKTGYVPWDQVLLPQRWHPGGL